MNRINTNHDSFLTIGIYLEKGLSVSIFDRGQLIFAEAVEPPFLDNLSLLLGNISIENESGAVCINDASINSTIFRLVPTFIELLVPQFDVILADKMHILHDAFSETSASSLEENIVSAAQKLDFTKNKNLSKYEIAQSFLTARYAWHEVKRMEILKLQLNE